MSQQNTPIAINSQSQRYERSVSRILVLISLFTSSWSCPQQSERPASCAREVQAGDAPASEELMGLGGGCSGASYNTSYD